MSAFSEETYELALIELFQSLEGKRYRYEYGPDIVRNYANPLLHDVLLESLLRINPELPELAIDEAIKKLHHIEGSSLYECNFKFTQMMQYGIEVTYRDDNPWKACEDLAYYGRDNERVEIQQGQKTRIVKLIDFDNPDNNDFLVVNQYTMQELDTKRPDIVVFVNGLPLVVIELKSPSREETDTSEAYLQLRNYQKFIPSLFIYNAFNVMSDMALTKIGTITAKEDRYMEWKQPTGEVADYDTAFRSVFTPKVFLNLLKNYLLFDVREGSYAKILAGYHQYYAVEKAALKTEEAVKGDGKIGVFWHTQGSGKSLSMIFLAHHPKVQAMNPTIVVITDRNDLDEQLYGQFYRTIEFLRQRPVQCTSRNAENDDTSLKCMLKNRNSGGVIFTTMQKFDDWDGALSERQNIIVMTDEAHRGQYGMEEKVDTEGNVHIGAARKIRNSLPNASYIGFTGTPISDKDRDTREIFGDDIDVYDMTQAVNDGATRPVYYESRVIKLKLNDEVLAQIDAEYERLREEGASETDLEENKKEMSHMDALLGNDATINDLVEDIISHYEDNRQYVCCGKAMIVGYSRPIAMKIYKRILELRPDWTEKVKVVMTSGNKDPEEWADIIGGKAHKKELAKKFKDENDPMKIAIVVDMWLTGFDVPSLATMYVYKPMKDHNLMQAIARVNRVFPEKAGGLIVDYVGIASALKDAMKRYTKRDQDNYGNNDIKQKAYSEFQEKLEICRDLLHGYDYSNFHHGTPAERAQIIKGAVNFMIAPEKAEACKEFIKNASLLRQTVTLCRSLLVEDERFEVSFMESVRILIIRLQKPGKITKKDINKRIATLIEQSVSSDGVVNLFDEQTEFSLFDEKFMEEVRKMKEKNLAAKLLEDLLRGRVRTMVRSNIVTGELFSDRFSETLNRYVNGLITNEEVIQELLKLAQEMMDAEKQGNELGLSNEEKAFYDALTRPQAVKDFYSNDQLVALTKELTDMLRKNRTIDWNRREAERANMRRLVKRLLKQYKYPPEEADGALDVVLMQCEQWAENEANYSNTGSEDEECIDKIFHDDIKVPDQDRELLLETRKKAGEERKSAPKELEPEVRERLLIEREARRVLKKKSRLYNRRAPNDGLNLPDDYLCAAEDDEDFDSCTYSPRVDENRGVSQDIQKSNDEAYDNVYSSVFSPAEVKRKSNMLIQVYLHLREEEGMVKSLAQDAQRNAERRDYIPLQCKLKRGDKVDISLNIYGETLLQSDRKSVVWFGAFTKCTFSYYVPKDIEDEELRCIAILSVNGAQIGEMCFVTQIVETPRSLHPEVFSRYFKKIFISYAHQDESKVKFIAQAYKAQGVDYFFDRDYLKAGDIFPQKIEDYINSADLFILCWSENAAKSDYVQKERNQALDRAYPKVKPIEKAPLSIYPLSIEPRAELPEDMKSVYNFELI